MKKGIVGLIVFMSLFNIVGAKELKIITREEWGADESFTDLNSTYWQDIIAKRLQRAEEIGTAAQESSYAKARVENKKRVDYVNANFADRYALSGKKTYNGDIQLAWPVSYSKKVDAILIHHTYSEYESSAEGIKNIYRYHTLSNQWGDIGYNYVIGYNGEIYEGRVGGDYAISSHSIWNNYSTISVSLMGNYDVRELTSIQYESLKQLIEELVYKYDIDLTKKIPLHHVCNNCTHGLETEYLRPIAGHKDGGNTACPGENIYNELDSLNDFFLRDQLKYKGVMAKLGKILPQSSMESLELLNKKLELLRQKEYPAKENYILNEISKKLSIELEKRAS